MATWQSCICASCTLSSIYPSSKRMRWYSLNRCLMCGASASSHIRLQPAARSRKRKSSSAHSELLDPSCNNMYLLFQTVASGITSSFFVDEFEN
ncbi:hypothetical protein EV356DRAFT_314570 [Viridothelium virens]|uniref:Uncharacterized protein n=1 Tax=Viridothelium virens TaxID=1048519 RepID=A0A6A6GZ36_VIRVR|nr:hypothetical protein EV356DRAFT_314570 [Viridothelium virens]